MKNIIRDEIKLDESAHRYYLAEYPDIEFVSCTTFVNYFFQKFDSIGIANSLTSSHPSYIDMSPQELVKLWDNAAILGSEIHKEIDNYIKYETQPTYEKSKLAVNWLKSLDKNKYEILSETILYSKEIKLAGTVDVILLDKESNTIEIFDWKTSKAINQRSYSNKSGNTPATVKLMDCNFVHYSLQLSLYKYILETYYGLKVSKITLLHLTGCSIIPYNCSYMKDTIEEMLKYDRIILAKKTEDSMTKEYNNMPYA